LVTIGGVHLPTAPSRRWQRAIAVAAVVTQAGIAVTGSVVRVTGSGLGCPSWPQCFPGSLTPVRHDEVASLHQWVEFGNRMLISVVGLVALACLVSAWLVRPRRPRLLALAAAMPAGVVVQAVVGGITVRTGLAWWTVSVHFLISMVLVWLAVLLVRAVGEGDRAPRSLVTPPARWLLRAAGVLLAALLAAGTFVTAAGPHAGDADTPRLELAVQTLARVHSGILFAFLAVLVTLGLTMPRTPRYRILLAVVAAQGMLGFVQYVTGVPEVLVSLHVLGAASVVVATAALWVSTRNRGAAAVAHTVTEARELAHA
jgi:cytochrome c oxidase assembly protein subunit 15